LEKSVAAFPNYAPAKYNIDLRDRNIVDSGLQQACCHAARLTDLLRYAGIRSHAGPTMFNNNNDNNIYLACNKIRMITLCRIIFEILQSAQQPSHDY